MNQTILTAVLSIAGVMLGASLQHYFGRALEVRKQLATQKSQSYVDYFKSVALIAQMGQTKDNLALAADAKVRICIYGSPKVIELLRKFETAGATLQTESGQQAIAELLNEMRRDTGMAASADAQDDFRTILFRRCGEGSQQPQS